MADEPNKLDDDVKAFVVQALACFDTPGTVAKAVKAEYGITVSPQQCEAYDPNKRAGARLSDKWKVLFEATRKKFVDDQSEIPISHRSTRLRALQRLAERAENAGNIALAAQLHEQAAKEVGNAFTNRRDLTSSDGTMSPPSLADFYGGKESCR